MYLSPYVDSYKANLNHLACFTALEWEMRDKNIYLLEGRVPSDFFAPWNVSLYLNHTSVFPIFLKELLYLFLVCLPIYFIFFGHTAQYVES